MKFELRYCKKCGVMANHFIKDGKELCGKCKYLSSQKPKLPPGWEKLFGGKK